MGIYFIDERLFAQALDDIVGAARARNPESDALTDAQLGAVYGVLLRNILRDLASVWNDLQSPLADLEALSLPTLDPQNECHYEAAVRAQRQEIHARIEGVCLALIAQVNTLFFTLCEKTLIQTLAVFDIGPATARAIVVDLVRQVRCP